MRILLIKLSTLFFLTAVFLTASPAHANLAALVSPASFQSPARTDLSMLEGLKPMAAPGSFSNTTFIEEPIFESELSGKLNQLRALRHMMRSA
jgi:hypothetical protein